ncbi:MAG: hypothetical protein IPJ33_12285 [Gammaproteobacteria bacterium]|nr:hypothetical protein [Gammaproteobacteria bacterium]MBP6052203.1 hypothetical protein [Pseudomonadales bacterium]MBK6582265.1 hypothetical protein [Gammaproteobacteria bacterium]MBK7171371.1 hypothetical protein [Gammaproteobacteria bacterium]MBK7521462.1 hypothetical protein [Gammaproteobacteria bacterium]
MSGCVFHFGMHKTGSSSIQNSLYHGLGDPAFHYADLGQPNASARIVTAFRAEPETQNMNRKLGLSREQLQPQIRETLERLHRELGHCTRQTVILSGEHIAFLKQTELRRLREFLRGHTSELRAVGYIRAPRSYMESVFQQHLQGGHGVFELERLLPRYRTRFEKLEAIFGAASMHYWYFEPESFPGGCVVRDFCRRLQIDFDARAIQRVNEGLSLPAVRLLYAYRKFGPGYGTGEVAVRQNAALVRKLRELAGPRLRLHPELVAPVIARHAAEIDWMEQRLQRSLDEAAAEPGAGAIRAEHELLCFEPRTLEWLGAQLGVRTTTRLRPDSSAEEVASRMHELRLEADRAEMAARTGFRRGVRRLWRRILPRTLR